MIYLTFGGIDKLPLSQTTIELLAFVYYAYKDNIEELHQFRKAILACAERGTSTTKYSLN